MSKTDTGIDIEFQTEWDSLAAARSLAAKLIVYRHDYDMTQEELASVLDVDLELIQSLESGEVQTSKAMLDIVEDIVDISPPTL